jgi:hypothetical protein
MDQKHPLISSKLTGFLFRIILDYNYFVIFYYKM